MANERFEVKAEQVGFNILVTTEFARDDEHGETYRKEIRRQVLDLEQAAIKRMLENMGWTPPKQIVIASS